MKLVLVTGASSGIGEAAAKLYGANGAHVLLLARNADRLDRVAEAIRRSGGTRPPTRSIFRALPQLTRQPRGSGATRARPTSSSTMPARAAGCPWSRPRRRTLCA